MTVSGIVQGLWVAVGLVGPRVSKEKLGFVKFVGFAFAFVASWSGETQPGGQA